MTPARQAFHNEMVLKGFSARTIESYTSALASLARYYNRSPEKISQDEIRQYILFLTNEKALAGSTCNVALSAFKFYYHHVLNEGYDLNIPYKKRKKRLPTLLNRDELVRLFHSVENLKHRLLLMTAYSTGVRRSELIRIKLTDIDSSEMTLRVNQGKGRKDRFTILSRNLLREMREYYKWYQPKEYLFYGTNVSIPLTSETPLRVFHKAKQKAGIKKAGGIHMLRHSFATHMLEQGCDLRKLQLMMGHKSLSTTAIYLHVATWHFKHIKSPFDDIPLPRLNPFAREN